MDNKAMAKQLHTWARALGEGTAQGISNEMRLVASALDPKPRVCQRISVKRYWFYDQKCVESRKADNPIEGWMRQVRAEFDAAAAEAGLVAYKGEGHSVIDWLSSDVKVSCCSNGNMTATFDVVLDFVHDEHATSFNFKHASDAIDFFFYLEGDVSGTFAMPDGSEA